MKYALIIDNIVVQVQPNEQEGFIKVGDDVVCGMIKEGDTFVNPIIIISENDRISLIKAKAGELILANYSIIWQLNHQRGVEAYSEDYDWIDKIREISNEAEANGTVFEDIDWGI